MIEAYSNNISVAAAQAITFNSLSLSKGCSVKQQNSSTFIFNKCGVYEVSFDAVANGSGGTGNVIVQLWKDGVSQPQALTSTTLATATDVEPISFKTLVQVPSNNNNNACCVSPTTIQFENTGVATLFNHANVVITKVK